MRKMKTALEQIHSEYGTETAEFFARNLHKPLNAELLKTAVRMMKKHSTQGGSL